MAAKLIGWNEWFSDRSSGHDNLNNAPRKPGDPDRPRYRRGSGLKVAICHKEHEEAAYYRKFNERAGNEVLEDEKGFLYVLVCRY